MPIIIEDLFRDYFTPDLQIEFTNYSGLLPHLISEICNRQKGSSMGPMLKDFFFLNQEKNITSKKWPPPP